MRMQQLLGRGIAILDGRIGQILLQRIQLDLIKGIQLESGGGGFHCQRLALLPGVQSAFQEVLLPGITLQQYALLLIQRQGVIQTKIAQIVAKLIQKLDDFHLVVHLQLTIGQLGIAQSGNHHIRLLFRLLIGNCVAVLFEQIIFPEDLPIKPAGDIQTLTALVIAATDSEEQQQRQHCQHSNATGNGCVTLHFLDFGREGLLHGFFRNFHFRRHDLHGSIFRNHFRSCLLRQRFCPGIFPAAQGAKIAALGQFFATVDTLHSISSF